MQLGIKKPYLLEKIAIAVREELDNVGSKTTYEILFEDICNLSESSKSPLY